MYEMFVMFVISVASIILSFLNFSNMCKMSKTHRGGKKFIIALSRELGMCLPHLRAAIVKGMTKMKAEEGIGMAPRGAAHRASRF